MTPLEKVKQAYQRAYRNTMTIACSKRKSLAFYVVAVQEQWNGGIWPIKESK
jgi:hypothetical protein